MLMQDASWHNQIILQWLSDSPTRWEIDSEIGKMEEDLLVVDTGSKGLLSYVRYNQWLDVSHLENLMGKGYTRQQVDNLVDMSNGDSRFELYDIGLRAAEKEVKDTHFPHAFTL